MREFWRRLEIWEMREGLENYDGFFDISKKTIIEIVNLFLKNSEE